MIDPIRIFLSQNNLRCHILQTPTIGARFLSRILRKPKIRDLDMPIVIDQYVFGFDIAVHDRLLVHILDAEDGFNEVEFGLAFGHITMAFHQGEQLARWTVIQNKDIEMFCFDKVVHLHKKWMLEYLVDMFFVVDQIDEFLFGIEGFIDEFACVKFAVFFGAEEEDFAESAC